MRRGLLGSTLVVMLAFAATPSAVGGVLSSDAPCRGNVTSEKFGETELFARIPDPGHPFGVLTTDRYVHVVTSSGFHAERIPAVAERGERLFTFSRHGELVSERRIDPQSPDMGFYGLAIDEEERLYASDMNGRVLRYQMNDGIPTGKEELYARTPVPYSLGRWMTSMWNGIAFDEDRNLYVADDYGVIWRISADGESEVWFRDARLAKGIAGPFGAAIGPDGMLYFVVVGSGLPGQVNDSIVFRLPLVDQPRAEDLHEFHRFSATPRQPIPGAIAIAFGRSGCAYVSLNGTNELSVLSRTGEEVRRVHLPGVMEPLGLSFLGPRLLVTSATNFSYPEDREMSKVVSVWVGDKGHVSNSG